MSKRLSPKQRAVANVMGNMRLDEFKKVVDNVVPCVYASLAMALYEKGWRYQRINDLFSRSQQIWTDNCMKPETIAEQCLEITGIDVRAKEGEVE